MTRRLVSGIGRFLRRIGGGLLRLLAGRTFRFLAGAACASVTLSHLPLAAHPLHISRCEADYRPETRKLEVAVRMFTDDAEIALSRRTGKKVRVDQTASGELNQLLSAYAQSVFVIKKTEGAVIPFTWIGHELKDTNEHLWIYFEYDLPDGIAGLRIDNRVMRETFTDQLNSVVVREHPPETSNKQSSRQLTLLFPDSAEHTVDFDPKN